MKIQEVTIGLDHVGDGPPVFDVEMSTLGGQPAPCRMVFGRVEKPKVLGSPPRLVHCAIFAVGPDEPKQKRRFGVLTNGGEIPDEIGEHAKFLGTYLHPRTGGPVSLYEFPWAPLDDEQGDQVAGPTDDPIADITAAVQHVMDAKDGAS